MCYSVLDNVLRSVTLFQYLCPQCCKRLSSSPSHCQTQSRRWYWELWEKLDRCPCQCSSTSSLSLPAQDIQTSQFYKMFLRKRTVHTWVTQQWDQVLPDDGKTFSNVVFSFCGQMNAWTQNNDLMRVLLQLHKNILSLSYVYFAYKI